MNADVQVALMGDMTSVCVANDFSTHSRRTMSYGTGPQQQLRTATSIHAFRNLLPVLVFILLALSSTCTATVLDRRKLGTSTYLNFARGNSARTIDGLWDPHEVRHDSIKARQNDGSAIGLASSPPASATAEASSTLTDVPSTPSSPPSQASLPQPFDTPLGNNFSSSSCPDFFNKFINDQNLINCVPLSLLLLNSQGFFQAEMDATALDQILSASCSVVGANCNNLMQSYASQLKDESNCGTDYIRQQPSVLRAYQGFVGYLPVYQAGCLKLDPNKVSSSKTGGNDYCFTSSINSSNPADSALYSLPLGASLPGDSRPTCSSCTQQTMAYFATGAQNLSTPLGQDYSTAAVQINEGCGPTFVNASVQPLPGTGGTSEASTIALVTAPWSMAAWAGLFLLFL